jgi:hypothetical protein
MTKDILDDATLQARYEAAKTDYARVQWQRNGEVTALHTLLAGYAETMDGMPIMKVAARAAQLFCIAAAFIIPVLLFLVVGF